MRVIQFIDPLLRPNGKTEDKFWTSFCRREECYFYATIQKLQSVLNGSNLWYKTSVELEIRSSKIILVM